MRRPTKKFIYGVFYLVILILIVMWIYNGIFTSDPTCFDGSKNQNETGVDCGGVCVPCDEKELSLLRPGLIQIFPLRNGRVVILGNVTNPNESHDAEKFSYDFIVYDTANHLLEKISGDDSVSSLERRYIFIIL